jgi:apolipoprotein N-acyltransferase
MKTRAAAYPVAARVLAAALVAISRASPLVLLVLLLVGGELRLDNPLRLIRAFTAFCLLPAAAAWIVEAACAATLVVENAVLTVLQRRRRVDVPCASVDAVIPWTIPLPAGGVSLRLKSGRRFEYGLQVDDPVALANALADTGASPNVRAASERPAAIYTTAKHSASRRWYHPLFKFVVFALVPTLPLFRLHQWIAYGGTFGEYYTYGLKAYLLGFLIYWATLTIHLVLYAAALRALSELVVLPATYLAPSSAARTRRVVEVTNRVLYYGGVPALVLWRFLAS